MTLATPAQALALLRKERVLTLVPARAGTTSIVEAVVGGKISGSWWGHEKGKLIFRLCEALEGSGEALVAKVVAGKVTFVHRALWPAFYRVVTDGDFERAAARGLPAAAQALYREVQKQGEVRVDRLPDPRLGQKKGELERRLLVLVSSEHTEKGSHQTVLRSWPHWASAEVKREAKKLAMEDAREELAGAGILVRPE
jgi:hypothetical protein